MTTNEKTVDVGTIVDFLYDQSSDRDALLYSFVKNALGYRDYVREPKKVEEPTEKPTQVNIDLAKKKKEPTEEESLILRKCKKGDNTCKHCSNGFCSLNSVNTYKQECNATNNFELYEAKR